MATAPKIDQIGERVILGEGPHWDADNQCLYYVDMRDNAFYKYNLESTITTKCTLPQGIVSLVIPLEGTNDKFVVSHNRKILIITWNGKSSSPSAQEEICEVDTDEIVKRNHLNDGKCDPFGRLYAGTMEKERKFGDIEKEKGSLYLFNLKEKTFKRLLDKISVANGLAWNPAKKKMYYIDTLTYRVDQFDYDITTGYISNRKIVFDFQENSIPGFPDGMCIDNQGMLWIACFNGSRVIQIDPDTNQLLRTIFLPVSQVTSLTFGGHNLDELYVTTAALENEANNPKAGYVYKITNLGDIKGTPNNSAKLL